MKPLIYDTTDHFTATDQALIKTLAKREGVSVGDFIERTLKRAIFAPSAPSSRSPFSKKKGEKAA